VNDAAVVLDVRDLRVTFPPPGRGRRSGAPAITVDAVSFAVGHGETVGIVGESGSGKSMTALAIMGLLPPSATVTGSIRLLGRELVGMSDRDMRTVRGDRVAMVFQDALAALNPVMTVGDQLVEAMRVHGSELTGAQQRERAIELLDLVGIPSPRRRVDQYPHQFSGGMRQRVMIAMSITNDPLVLIADEPTTALDVTVQAQILDVLRNVQERTGTSVVLITHDLGVVAGIADRVLVMYAGNVVEDGPADDVFHATAHPYTAGLLASLPRMDRRSKDTRLFQIGGQPPTATALPNGCRFAPRCDHAVAGTCDSSPPPALSMGQRHVAVCHRAHDLVGRLA
jgi:oligopeptide/dipeptide ABC transporter ATP-binding protein